jgi:signal transduction histidine kinase/FixJ family two-component response regulator
VSTATSEKLKLLLVEDDEVDRMAVRRVLRQAAVSADIDEATDFGSARAALMRGGADCVLLDFHLPGGDGLELLQLASTSGSGAPIIILTGQGDEALAVELMKAGAVDYLPKRLLSPERLSQSIRQAIRLQEAEGRAKRAHEALEHQAAQLLLLSESSLGLHAAITLEETLELVTRLARELMHTRVAAARIGGAGLPELVRQSHAEDSGVGALSDDELARWEKLVWKAGKCVVLSERALESDGDWGGSGRLKGVLAAPLTGREGQAIGSLLLTERIAGQFEQRDGLMLVQLSKAASVALESSRLYREAQAASRARDETLAIVSHDLRNPLGVVGISAGLLRQTLKDTPDAQIVQRIDRSIHRMARLIDDLMAASRIDSGTLAVQRSKVKASLLVADALEAAGPLAAAQHCVLRGEPGAPALHVLADPERLMQVFSNLIGNALKYVVQEGATVTVSYQLDGARVRFCVADNGAGISAEGLPHVFERAWKGRTSESDGAGLGLYIVKGIIDAHGGAIAVDSTLGEGTTVKFWLPLAD